ncbi:MAG: 30S ribosomal protein S6 [Candidatus Marinimicrobia bacterium]|jgi:small subunit ribosomal protein S6|nr:30S ribosomal protein S6 [Candidatus Neomarinimicrobiota bacterium]
MRYYESLYIVNPNYEQERLDEVMQMVADKMGEYGFSIINHRVWGKKRLAYSIQKHKYGSFILLQYETELAENLDRFERFMVLQKPILRNQTMVLDTRPEIHVEEEPVADESEEASVETEVEEATENTPETIETTEAAEEESPEESAEEKVEDNESGDEESSEVDETEEVVEKETEEVQE